MKDQTQATLEHRVPIDGSLPRRPFRPAASEWQMESGMTDLSRLGSIATLPDAIETCATHLKRELLGLNT
jgi:hypothetical protein